MRFQHNLFESVHLERVEKDGQRHYKTPTGGVYPSVTTVLGRINAKAIQEWRDRVGHEEAKKISTKASNRGTAVHDICERYLLNEQEYTVNSKGKKHNPQVVEMFRTIQPYLDEHVGMVYGVETRMWSDQIQMAGTCDCICSLHGVPSIVDFKTASKRKEERYILNYFLQAAAYAIMVEERFNFQIKGVGILIATEHDGLQPFLKPVEPYKQKLLTFLRTGIV